MKNNDLSEWASSSGTRAFVAKLKEQRELAVNKLVKEHDTGVIKEIDKTLRYIDSLQDSIKLVVRQICNKHVDSYKYVVY